MLKPLLSSFLWEMRPRQGRVKESKIQEGAEGGFLCHGHCRWSHNPGILSLPVSGGLKASQPRTFPFSSFPLGFWAPGPLHPLLDRTQLPAVRGKLVLALCLSFPVWPWHSTSFAQPFEGQKQNYFSHQKATTGKVFISLSDIREIPYNIKGFKEMQVICSIWDKRGKKVTF